MKYTILICCFLLFFCCGCLQNNMQQPVSTPVVTPIPTPVPPPIVGNWEGTVDFYNYAAYRITFTPNHRLQFKPLTSEGTSYSGTWNQCITDVECLPSEAMYKAGRKYTTDDYVIGVDMNFFGKAQTIADTASLQGNTLNYRGTLHRV